MLCMLHLGRDGSLYLLQIIYESCQTGLELVWLDFFLL